VAFNPPYTQIWEQREQDPLDPNQQLMAPAWWNQGQGCTFFEQYFHPLRDPTASAPNPIGLWDRSPANFAALGLYPRRAYYTKFLIVSGGLDGQVGIYQAPQSLLTAPITIGSIKLPAINWESCALQYDPNESTSANQPNSVALQNAGQDDISNHNLSSPGGVTR
jgi:hypothetical protein